MTRPTPRPRRALLAGVGVVVIVAAVVVSLVATSAPQAPETAGEAMPRVRITYRVEEPASGTTTTTVVEVDRPYRGRVRTYRDGDVLAGGSIWTEEASYLISADGTVQAVQAVAPAAPGPDVRLDYTLDEAVASLGVERLDRSAVIDTPCTQYRSLAPLDGARPAAPTADEYVRSCVDDRGRLLADEWYVHGALFRRRTATALEVGDALDNAELFGGATPPALPDKLVLTIVTRLDAPPDSPFAVSLPEEIDGLPLDLIVTTRDVPQVTSTPIPERLGYRATYTDGSRLVIIEQSRLLAGIDGGLPDGEPFALPPLTDAVLRVGLDGLGVVGMVGDVRVEIRGTLTRAQLEALTL